MISTKFASDYEMKTYHTKKIQDKYLFLLENIDTTSDLLGHLLAVDVIDMRQKEDISSAGDSFKQTKRLLSILSRKSADDYEQFLTALSKANQKHIVKALHEELGKIYFSASYKPCHLYLQYFLLFELEHRLIWMKVNVHTLSLF